MNLLDSLKQHIAGGLAAEKSYNLPSLCTALGLAPGEESEAFASKYKYVMRRLQTLNKTETFALAKQVLERFSSYPLEETLDLLLPLDGVMPAITRRDLIDKLSETGDLHGRLYINEFIKRTFPLSQISYDDYRYPTLDEAVAQHMIRNDDWSYKDLIECLDYLKLSERRFRMFLEQIVHPEVRTGGDQQRFVDIINSYIARDGLELVAVEQMSGYPVYRVVKKGGVAGHCKNLIFAANDPKPELVLADAINNDIRITKNEDFCLVYDLPIGIDGLRWKDLVDWWAAPSPSDNPERKLYARLFQSLSSEPEKKSSGSTLKSSVIRSRRDFPRSYRSNHVRLSAFCSDTSPSSRLFRPSALLPRVLAAGLPPHAAPRSKHIPTSSRSPCPTAAAPSRDASL
jgi:hypothetical protein